MRSLGFFLLILVGGLISGCASTPENDSTWYVGVAAPKHYSVWVRHFELEASGVRHWRMPIGMVECCWKGPNGPRGSGGSLEPFPDYIGIEWFSFAEQKTYQRLFSLPDGLLEKMRQPATYTTSLGSFQRPRDMLTIGLAPGGTIVLWIKNQIGNEIEVARLQANEVDKDVSPYKVGIENYLEEHGDYLEQHGVPTEGW
ncbi:DUF2931 family protein [Marinobacter fonticola]|uniref:DUF2931 family protein n=1 Tax=Marinobacter fonticola TaxID=2603215 RepID=UPI0011E7874D|nr:DUF2931 family protein [Marinobacter fonticola]